MLFIKFVIIFFLSSVVADYLYALLGFLLVKTRRFHRTGRQMLIKSPVVPRRFIPRLCRIHWCDALCGGCNLDDFEIVPRK